VDIHERSPLTILFHWFLSARHLYKMQIWQPYRLPSSMSLQDYQEREEANKFPLFVQPGLWTSGSEACFNGSDIMRGV